MRRYRNRVFCRDGMVLVPLKPETCRGDHPALTPGPMPITDMQIHVRIDRKYAAVQHTHTHTHTHTHCITVYQNVGHQKQYYAGSYTMQL